MHSKVAKGFAWSMTAQVARQLSRFVVALVLARLLTPSEFGLAGMALVFVTLAQSITDLGLGAALVQRESLSEADKCTVFWTNVALGLALTLGGIALSGPIAAWFGEPSVQPLFAVASLGFVIMSFQTVQFSILQREMNFRATELRIIICTVAGGAAGVGAALAGVGAWALIVQQLVLASVSSALLWQFSEWRPRLIFSWTSARELGRLGMGVFTNQSLPTAVTTGQNLAIGKFLGSAALGSFTVATNLVMLPILRLIVPAQEVLYPAFARMQSEPERMGRLWLRANRMIGLFATASLLGLVAVAPDFVQVLLGSRWESVSPLLQILAPGAAVVAVTALSYKVLAAMNRPAALFHLTIFWSVVILVAFAAGIPWGTKGVATAYTLSTVVTQTVAVTVAMRAIGMPLRAFRAHLVDVVKVSAYVASGALIVRLSLGAWGMPVLPRLLTEIAVGIVIFLVATRLDPRSVLGELKGVLRDDRDVAALPIEPIAQLPIEPVSQ